MDIGRPQRIIEIEPASLPVPGVGEPLLPQTEPLHEPAMPDSLPEPANPVPDEPVPAEPVERG